MQFFFKVTFLTIGYGDITPVTVLGRSICILTGFMVKFKINFNHINYFNILVE